MPTGIYKHYQHQGFQKGHKIWLGRKLSNKHRKKLSLAKKGKLIWYQLKNLPHPSYVNGNYKKQQQRNDSAYQNWVKEVKKRDNNTCRIQNKDCSGYNIVHHILPVKDFPELMYKINNGITLCQAHHPRKRAEEKRLIPTFQELVSVSNELI